MLHKAVAAGADLVEADIWPHRGRLEVRHLKTLGPVPVLWDRWKLARGWTPRLLIAKLLDSLPPDIGLMLDLKGHNRLAAAEIADLSSYLAIEHRLYVCARDWEMLEPFRHTAAEVVHSAGKAWELERLQPLIESGECRAVSIHQRLLGREAVQQLLTRVHTLMTWPVNDIDRMQELLSWGVNGITTDSLEVVRAIQELKVKAGAPGV
jgi:glycerophosphoryl diester phosphodiesterase